MNEAENLDIDPDWFKKNKVQRLLHQLEAHQEKEMLEIERLLFDYLEAMLHKTHRQLLRGAISLPQYYKETMMLAECGQRLNRIDEDL